MPCPNLGALTPKTCRGPYQLLRGARKPIRRWECCHLWHRRSGLPALTTSSPCSSRVLHRFLGAATERLIKSVQPSFGTIAASRIVGRCQRQASVRALFPNGRLACRKRHCGSRPTQGLPLGRSAGGRAQMGDGEAIHKPRCRSPLCM